VPVSYRLHNLCKFFFDHFGTRSHSFSLFFVLSFSLFVFFFFFFPEREFFQIFGFLFVACFALQALPGGVCDVFGVLCGAALSGFLFRCFGFRSYVFGRWLKFSFERFEQAFILSFFFSFFSVSPPRRGRPWCGGFLRSVFFSPPFVFVFDDLFERRLIALPFPVLPFSFGAPAPASPVFFFMTPNFAARDVVPDFSPFFKGGFFVPGIPDSSRVPGGIFLLVDPIALSFSCRKNLATPHTPFLKNVFLFSFAPPTSQHRYLRGP